MSKVRRAGNEFEGSKVGPEGLKYPYRHVELEKRRQKAPAKIVEQGGGRSEVGKTEKGRMK